MHVGTKLHVAFDYKARSDLCSCRGADMASLLREASVHALREIIKADPEGENRMHLSREKVTDFYRQIERKRR